MKEYSVGVAGLQNSKRTRIDPVFTWLDRNGGGVWPAQLIRLADGLERLTDPGMIEKMVFRKEHKVAASPRRLAWMIRNVGLLAPVDGRRYREPLKRVERPTRDEILARLESGESIPSRSGFILEGPTSADCFIVCAETVIWVEGKRNDWFAPSTKWDVTRDQLARNLEAAWFEAGRLGKDFCVIVIHEHPLKHHEQSLVDGYRKGTWRGGIPHLDDETRGLFRTRIGTVTWTQLVNQWPDLGKRLL